MVRLNNVYRSLRDGMSKREDYFDVSLPEEETEVTDPFKGKSEQKKEGNDGKKDKTESE